CSSSAAPSWLASRTVSGAAPCSWSASSAPLSHTRCSVSPGPSPSASWPWRSRGRRAGRRRPPRRLSRTAPRRKTGRGASASSGRPSGARD
ncbi:MAG: hypothetical protein AVDCRST_MAG88-4720, partial [uncultured Thermomicrobiales bacterium]